MTGDRPCVLVVDDDLDTLEIVTTVLELHGVPALTASDGIDALAVMRGPSAVGLVLLDLMMPRMSGVEVLAEMKRDAALATLPVVVVSGNYQTEQAVLGMGADEYLLKPLEVDELMGVVARFVPVPGFTGHGGTPPDRASPRPSAGCRARG